VFNICFKPLDLFYIGYTSAVSQKHMTTDKLYFQQVLTNFENFA